MADLVQLFASLGCQNIKSYLQSGNVIFEIPDTNPNVISNLIEKEIYKSFGFEVTVLVSTFDEIKSMVKVNPFKEIKTDEDVKMYVTFLKTEPTNMPELPLISFKKDIKIFEITNREIFSLAFPDGNGRFGFPNSFIEKEFGILATTRGWNTIRKLIK